MDASADSESETAARESLDDRLRVLGVLAAGANHELAGAIHRVTHSLLRIGNEIAKQGSDDQRRVLDPVLRSAREDMQRLDLLSRALQAVVQPGTGPIKVRSVIDDAITLTAPIVASCAQLVPMVDGSPCTFGDRSALLLIVTHLIVNAAQAIRDGDPTQNEIRVTAATVNRTIVIVVSDTGHGIAEHVRARIFEPRFSTRATRTNSGMGLFVAAECARALNGSITCEHAERGAAFRVVLPEHLARV